jgi:hypothetical protein
MELDFDKEIDALLRKARRDSPAAQGAPASRHLDADEMSAFVENVVPERSRAFYVAHLADCDSCRRTLVELNSLNTDAAPATASEAAAAVAVSEMPWWKRLFAMPNLAYAMGVLVLLFSGLMGYLVLQRSPASRDAQIARVNERETYTSTSNANTAASAVPETANTSTDSVANTTSNNPLGDVQRSGVAVGTSGVPAESESKPEGNNETNQAATANESARVSPPPPPPATSVATPEQQPSIAAAAPMAKAPAKPAKDDKTEPYADTTAAGSGEQPNKNQAEMQDAEKRKALRAAPLVVGPTQGNAQSQIAQQSVQNNAIFTRTVKGRTFEYRNGGWYDRDYTGGATTNVHRGTEEFKKLDDGLRSIAGKLDGTIVVVWKGKAYKIQ